MILSLKTWDLLLYNEGRLSEDKIWFNIGEGGCQFAFFEIFLSPSLSRTTVTLVFLLCWNVLRMIDSEL